MRAEYGSQKRILVNMIYSEVKMISNNSNISQGLGSWLKWMIGTAVALVAAGSGIVAILEYFEPESTYAPTDNSITVVIVTTPNAQSDPQPTEAFPQAIPTSLPPTVSFVTPMVVSPSPVDFVISYWQNVSDGRYENAWMQLSPRFQQAMHRGDYSDYERGYLQINLCRIVVGNVNALRQDSYLAVVTAHLTYYTGSQCNSSEYDFEMWLVYEGASNSWLFDKNYIR